MEYWDLYDGDRNKLGRTHLRTGDCNTLNPGEYHLAAHIWIINNKGEVLLSQRHPKKAWPLKWECPGGAAISGEDGMTAALREAQEEIGIRLEREEGRLIFTKKQEINFVDVFLFKKKFDIKDAKPQETEVVAIKWASRDELLRMAENGDIAEPLLDDLEKLQELNII
ncbi:MAG: NUDIX domain-containing protein [Treponema sp.]|nr:NUDIX domain-containing protein [Treponema sp.]